MIDRSAKVASVISSLRYLLADFIGEDDDAPPFLPEGLPQATVPIASEGIHLLMHYQGSSYAQLYVDRVRRFVGRRGVDEEMLGQIARLMALRMSYEDPIRIAQLKLAELESTPGDPRLPSVDVRKFRLDELIGALPAAVAEPARRDAVPLIETRSLTRHFKVGGNFSRQRLHAVDDANIAIHSREIVALVGESGSGKSTIARLLAQVYKPQAEVYLTGVRLLGLQPSEVMMVAAHPFDLEGARGAGLRTAFIDRPLEYGPDSPQREDPEADISVNDLHELAARLEGPSA